MLVAHGTLLLISLVIMVVPLQWKRLVSRVKGYVVMHAPHAPVDASLPVQRAKMEFQRPAHYAK